MSTFDISTNINAPASTVWAYLADLEEIDKFHPAVSHSFYTTEPREGVTGWDERRRMDIVIDSTENMPRFEQAFGAFTLETFGNSTQVHLLLSYELKKTLFSGFVNAVIVAPQMRKNLNGMLDNLKALAESESTLAQPVTA